MRRKRSEKDQALGGGKQGRDRTGPGGGGGSGRGRRGPSLGVLPPDPALSRPGLSEEQRNQEQQEESSGSHAPHPGGLGRESGGCSETL